MALPLARLVSAFFLAVSLAGSLSTTALACMWNETYEPDRPFNEIYFSGAKVIFRGHPIGYHYPGRNLNDLTIFGNRAEVTFSVTETYQGGEREAWTALWVTTAFLKPVDLLAFKHEIGDDLVIVLEKASGMSDDLPFVAHLTCGQPGMRSYEVMQPVLREQGLIE